MYSASAGLSCVPQQSSLVYTLTDAEQITYDEFSLIIRSLHSYKVIGTEECRETNTITVTLEYFANAGNARRRLGKAAEFISVARLSSNIRNDELQTLNMLKRKFEFGRDYEEEEPETSKPGKGKKQKYAKRD